MKIALCLGHSRPRKTGGPEGGAVSVGGVSEWSYNSRVAPLIAAQLRAAGHTVLIVDSYQGASYGAAITWLAAHLRKESVDIAVELHFNSADDPAARGHEWLIWPTSTAGRSLATHIDSAFRTGPLRGLPARGVKPRGTGDGSQFLRRTHCTALIAEPFFGSSPEDWKIFGQRPHLVADTIAAGILSHISATRK